MKIGKEDRILRQRLRENDPTLQRLEISHWMGLSDDEDSTQDFLETLSGNTSVESLSISAKAVQTFSSDTILRILDTASTECVNLRSVEISTPVINRVDKAIAGNVVVSLLQKCRNLETLVLWPFVLLDSMKVIDDLALVLRDNQRLRTLSLLNVMLEKGRQRQNTNNGNSEIAAANKSEPPVLLLDPVVQALACLPSLTNIHLSPCFRVQKDRCLIAVPKCVTRDLLQSSLTSASRSTLQSLSLRNMGLDDTFGVPLAMALRNSRVVLQHLDLRFNTFGKPTSAAFCETLENFNTTVTSLSLDTTCTSDEDYSHQINLLVRLNAAGRGVLVRQGGPLTACWDGFYASCDDTDVMFHLLRVSPQLFVKRQNS